MRIFQALILGVVLVVTLVATPMIANADCIVIKMDKTKPNGKPWDDTGVCTEPDPYVVVNGHDYEDKACDDTFTCRIQIKSAGSLMTVKVYDQDVGPDDYAGSCVLRKDSNCSTRAGATVHHSSSSCNMSSEPVADVVKVVKDEFSDVGVGHGLMVVMVAVLRWFGSLVSLA